MSSILWTCLILAAIPAPLIARYIDHQYVISCPWLEQQCFCIAYIVTPEKIAVINMEFRLNRNIMYEKNFPVSRYEWFEYKLLHPGYPKKNLELKKSFPVYRFYSLKQFRVIVVTRNKKGSLTDVISLTPQSQCYISYYTVTANGFPFFTVFTFDYVKTLVTVQCPVLNSPTNHYWQGMTKEIKDCTHRKPIRFVMSRYQAFYMGIDHQNASLRNVLITSTYPVYVVSGNRADAWMFRSDASKDITTTSLKPSTVWGKEYLVPFFDFSPRMFAINAQKDFLLVLVHECRDAREHRTLNYTFRQGQAQTMHKYEKEDTVLLMTASDPFGLYQIFPSLTSGMTWGDVSVLNLIPVEQWRRGIVYLKFKPLPGSYGRYILMTEAPVENVVFRGESDSTKLVWNSLTIFFKGRTFSVGQINLDNWRGSIYVNNSFGRMMMHILMLSSDKRYSGMNSFPCQANQGEIYQSYCKVSERVEPDDGIDNDCDGYIDEEVENGVDDDGDGKIDEDFVASISDGHWSEWSFVCKEAFNKSSLPVAIRVRSCKNRTTYGRDCDGENIQCDGQTCPLSDSASSSTPGSHDLAGCFCDANCLTCQSSRYTCDGCKQGYRSTEHCLTPCPEGTKGIDCSELVPVKDFLYLYVATGTLLLSMMVVGISFICCSSQVANRSSQSSPSSSSPPPPSVSPSTSSSSSSSSSSDSSSSATTIPRLSNLSSRVQQILRNSFFGNMSLPQFLRKSGGSGTNEVPKAPIKRIDSKRMSTIIRSSIK